MHRCMSLVLAVAIGVPGAARGQVGLVAQDGAMVAFLDSTVALAQRRDTAGLRRLADERFAFVHSTGRVQDLAGFLAFVVQGRQDSIRVLSPPEVRDAGAAAYVITHTASWAPGRGWVPFRATDVVIRTPDGLRWLGHQSTALPTAASFVPLAPGVATAVSGRYVSAGGATRDVTADGDRLLVRVDGGPALRYGALTATTFRAEGGDAYMVFVRDERGRIRSLEFLQGGRAERYERGAVP